MSAVDHVGQRGRQPSDGDAVIQTCLTMKVLSTLCRRQKTLRVSIPYRGSHDSLHLLIDEAVG